MQLSLGSTIIYILCQFHGTSIYGHDPGGKVARACHALMKEVLQLERQRQKAKSDLLR